MVLEQEMFRREHNTSQIEDLNWAVRCNLGRNPNLEIQPEMRALAQSLADMEDKGIASGRPDILSRMVKR